MTRLLSGLRVESFSARSGERKSSNSPATRVLAGDAGVSLGKGAWDCDAKCVIPPELEVKPGSITRQLTSDHVHVHLLVTTARG